MNQLSAWATSLINWFKFWWTCSRAFALPVTVMTWLIAFTYCFDGNKINGLIALVGIIFAHLATNIFDDYNDYKILCKDKKYLESAQICKCKMITDGLITHKGLLKAALICCGLASVTGLFLTYKTGYGVLLIAAIASIFVLFYSQCTTRGLGEIAVGLMYGPLLFEGMQYIMKGSFSLDILFLALSVAFFIIAFLYTHTLLDYDGDKCSHKKTLACTYDKNTSLKILLLMYTSGYILITTYSILMQRYLLLMTFITIPLVMNLYKTMQIYNNDKTIIPEIKWWNYPLGEWDYIEKEGSQSFYLRLYLSRNINTYFALIICMAFLLEKLL